MKLVRGAWVVVAFSGLACAPRVDAPASAATVILPPAETPSAHAPAPPVPAAPTTAAVTTIDLPKAVEWIGARVIFAVQVSANGELFVDGAKVGSDAEVLNLARLALGKTPELRAVIQADQAVTYGRVIHVLDVLKQAGVTKIAFGVSVGR